MAKKIFTMSRDYYLWFTGDSFFDLGSSVRQIAIPLIAYGVTHSTKSAGIISMCVSIGGLLTMIPSGVIADYYDRRRTMMLLGSIDAVLAAFMAYLIYSDQINMAWLIGLGLVTSIMGTIIGTTNNALLKNVVTTEQFPTAMSLNQGRNATISIIGGPVGGALYALASYVPIAVYSLTALIRAITSGLITSSGKQAPRVKRNYIKKMLFGMHVVFREPSLLTLTLVASILNYAGTGIFLTIILNLQQVHTPAYIVGGVFTAVSIGAMVGAPLAGVLMHKVPTGKLIIVGFIIECVALSLQALSSNIIWIFACLIVTFVALPSINGSVEGFLMASVPSEFQGRVGSAVGFVATLISPLSPLSAGWFLEDFGRETSILLFSAVFVVALVMVLVSRSVRTIPLPNQWDEHSARIRQHCEAMHDA